LRAAARADEVDLYYLDQCGLAPTLPTSYTWARAGVRVVVPYEAPQGRRVNVIGALAPLGSRRRLVWRSRTKGDGPLDSAVFLDFLWREVAALPAPPEALPIGYQRGRPCAVVLDNYSVHHSKAVQAALPALPALAAAGVTLFYLPPYSPELNAIEPRWGHLKYEQLQVRSYQTAEALQAAVDEALTKQAVLLRDPTTPLSEAA
jgi:DDE superfamily endonuclease